MKNGEIWLDVTGKPIHAHGGCRLEHDGYIYWYGENRSGDNYVSCYVSKDEGNTWEFCNHVLTAASAAQATSVSADLSLKNDAGGKVNIERPKVLYNKRTKKFVMWAHYENGKDYMEARCAVASCDTPDGDFTYHGSFRPCGNMSRDCTLFEDDGKAYFISAGRDNADLYVYRLSEDFLSISAQVNCLFPDEYREAPALIKKDGKYLIVTSQCTGWHANQSGYSVSEDIEGEWSPIQKLGDETTFGSQSAFLYRRKDGEIVYFGDRWGGNAFLEGKAFVYEESLYVAYLIQWENGEARLIYSDTAML